MAEKNDTSKELHMQQSPKQIELVRKFELAIFNEDISDDGNVKYKQLAFERPIIIEATSQQDLNDKLAVYKDAGQIAKVVREIDPPTKEQIEQYISAQQQNVVKQSTTQQNTTNQQIQQTVNLKELNASNVSTTKPNLQELNASDVCVSKPKYYKVGDIEIKDDNGKIYQKQWMKLSDSEASNIRLINDKSNALVNINGKHFEMKRWVLVDTTYTDDSSQLEENLKC